MSSFLKNRAIAGMKFRINESQEGAYYLKPAYENRYNLLVNENQFVGIVDFTYKGMVIEIINHGLSFTKIVYINDLIFVEENKMV